MPPYDPAHPESVTFAPHEDRQYDTSRVVARCGRHWTGPPRALGTGNTAAQLIDDFNAHRATYATGAAS